MNTYKSGPVQTVRSSAHGVKCGNRKVHGTDRVYHASPAEVKACFAGISVEQAVTTMRATLDASPSKGVLPNPAGAHDSGAGFDFAAGATDAMARLAAAREQVKAEKPKRDYSAWATIPVDTDDYARYALPHGSGVRLYRVRRPSTGQYAGKTYIDRETSSGAIERMEWAEVCSALDRIAEDPLAAAILYGQSTTTCGICHRTLRTDESVARGIGPKCAKKIGG